MKILNILAQKPHSTGSAVYMKELLRSFHKMGIENAAVAGIDHSDCIQWQEPVEFYPVYFETKDLPYPVPGMSDSMPYPSTVYSTMTAEMQNQFEAAFIKVITKAIEETKPDFILCHHLYFLTTLVREYFPQQKIGAVCHGTDLRQYMKIDLQNDRIRKNLQKMDAVFVLHEAQREKIRELFSVPDEKIHTVGVGYNNHIFYNQHLEKSKAHVQLIYAGRLSEKKGVPCLLKALGRVRTEKPVKLTLAGGYSCEEEYQKIRKLAEPLGDRVEFAGKLTQTQLAERFNQSHIFVLPSFFEGLPLVVVEAMACSLKVITTDLPGVKQWIDSNVQENQIVFVRPPKMKNVDEPEKESEQKFVERLTAAIEQSAAEIEKFQAADTGKISWDSTAERILSVIGGIG